VLPGNDHHPRKTGRSPAGAAGYAPAAFVLQPRLFNIWIMSYAKQLIVLVRLASFVLEGIIDLSKHCCLGYCSHSSARRVAIEHIFARFSYAVTIHHQFKPNSPGFQFELA